ncbi:hypothetical protein [Amycolatopsis sacchari]|uniref:hypothetical protein n=1 Tax=Amycolatopsis sacchari TaxID=115433 RepID=UPI001FE4F906|nr:hypothetical protein [Amycolatopsis sacchari]
MVRSRSVWGVLLTGIVALAVAGCTEAVKGQPFAAGTSSSSAAPSSSRSAAPSSSSASSAPGGTVTVATMTVTLPQGMRYTGASSGGALDGCVSDGSAQCVARMLDLRAAANDPNAPFNAPSVNRPYGWYTGTDVPQCITPSAPPGSGPEATGSTVIESGLAPIGPKKAEYARWQVTCADATQNNQVRMWWLPTSKILVTEYAASPDLDARIDAILAGATFG